MLLDGPGEATAPTTRVAITTEPETLPSSSAAVMPLTGVWVTSPPPVVIRSTIVPVVPAPAPTAAFNAIPPLPPVKVIAVLLPVVDTAPCTPIAPVPDVPSVMLFADSGPVTVKFWLAALFSARSPAAVNVPKVATALVAVLRLTAPDEDPVSVPAVTLPPGCSVIVPALSVNIPEAPRLTAPVMVSGLAPLFRLKSLPPELKAPKLPIAFVAVLRSTALATVPDSVLAVRAPLPLIPPAVSSSSLVPLAANVPPTTIEPAVVVRPLVPGTEIAPIRTVLAVTPARFGRNRPPTPGGPPSVTDKPGVYGATSKVAALILPRRATTSDCNVMVPPAADSASGVLISKPSELFVAR
jgi:hypothetical protein